MEMLAKDFKKQAIAIEKTFLIVDECIDIFNEKAGNDDFHRICGLVLAKARNYALGAYGLILDGLGKKLERYCVHLLNIMNCLHISAWNPIEFNRQ